jgi:CDP-diacylglycerol--glycerol-3-phosphate 3-phosphatidyltransferase
MTISNMMTISRFLLSPVFIVVFLQEGLWARIGAFAIVAINELTDLFDGIIARRRNEITDFGKIADPLADSVSRFTVFLCFIAAGYAPVWMIAFIFYRDIVVSYVRVLAGMHGKVMGARRSGKFKAMAQGPSTLIILLLDIIREMTPIPWFHQFTFILIGFVTLVTVISGIDYVIGTRHYLKRLKLQ